MPGAGLCLMPGAGLCPAQASRTSYERSKGYMSVPAMLQQRFNHSKTTAFLEYLVSNKL